jgi:hypothetical protein
MKKFFALTICLFFVSAAAFSQIKIGVKAGANLANQELSGGGVSLDTETKFGIHAGAFAQIAAGPLAIQPEVLFSTQGSKYTWDFGGDPQEVTSDFQYLLVPVMAKFKFAKVLNVQVGPQYGILLSAEQEAGDQVDEIKDEVKNGDFSLAFGAGVEFGKLIIDARYVLGLTDLDEEDTTYKNRMFMISLGFSFL